MSDAGLTAEELRESIHEVLQGESNLSLVRAAQLPGGRAASSLGEDLWQKMAALGWFGLAIPEQYGGLGLGFRHLALLYEELGQFLTPLPVMSTLLVADSISMAGSAKQKLSWLVPIAAGEIRASLALPTAAVDLPRVSDNHIVSGAVTDVLDGVQVAEFLLPVRDRSDRIYLAIVARTTAGVQVESRPVIDLTRSLAQVQLSDVELTPDRLMPIDDELWRAILDHACVALASDAVGGATRILADTVAYLVERRQFDRPIGSFQALKHRVASWKIQVEAISALTRHCADLLADADPARSEMASAAKASATETYVKVAGDAIQLHGGIGFTWQHECHLFLKRAVLSAALFGSIMQHKDRAARFAFGGAKNSHGSDEHEVLRRFFSH
jgi:alkylation response protein AidB-like acyl-CoA dehydrogenase